jgi:hypothetical protein
MFSISSFEFTATGYIPDNYLWGTGSLNELIPWKNKWVNQPASDFQPALSNEMDEQLREDQEVMGKQLPHCQANMEAQ